MKRLLLPLFSFTFIFFCHAQNREYAHTVVKELSSGDYYGRAYDKNGQRKAADFLATEFERLGLAAFPDAGSYRQEFKTSLNRFKGKMKLTVGTKTLRPGHDYTVRLSSPAVKGTFEVIHVTNEALSEGTAANHVTESVPENKFLVMDYDYIMENHKDFKDELKAISQVSYAGIIYLTKEPLRFYSIRGKKVSDRPVINIDPASVDGDFETITLSVHSKFNDNIRSQNIMGYIPGSGYPEKFIVFTAHYDHLGSLGKGVYFPGADDNASGVAMLLDLAMYYTMPGNRPECSVAFVACGSEEIGLQGSYHFVSNPPIPLENILLNINFDMISFGNEGLKVINGIEFSEGFELLSSINKRSNYVPGLEAMENTPHSDHYPFTEKGIPALFLSTGTKASADYHTVGDTYKSAPLDRWEGIFRLVRDLVAEYINSNTHEISSR